MAYVKCKIWHFQGNDDRHEETHYRAMKAGYKHHAVKALIDTGSSENFISKNLADKLRRNMESIIKTKE